MRESEIKIGGIYTAKVSGKIVRVRVDKAVVQSLSRCCFEVTNLDTGHRLTFRSAQKFRSPFGEDASVNDFVLKIESLPIGMSLKFTRPGHLPVTVVHCSPGRTIERVPGAVSTCQTVLKTAAFLASGGWELAK